MKVMQEKVNGTTNAHDHKKEINKREKTLAQNVEEALLLYFDYLDGQATAGLYDLVMTEVEVPLLKTVMSQAGANLSKAAEILGLNRATLRKKMVH